MKKIVSAGFALFCREGDVLEYLLLHYVGGHWGFPKGKIEPGESKRQAALRELKEETGLSAQIHEGFEQSLAYFFSDRGARVHKTVHFLVAETTSKHVILSHEHIGFAWLPYEQAFERLTFDNAKQVLQKADFFIRSI